MSPRIGLSEALSNRPRPHGPHSACYDSLTDTTGHYFPGLHFSGGILIVPVVLCPAWPHAACKCPRSRPLLSALGDDLPRCIEDKAAIFTAASNSSQRYLQCCNLVGIEGPLGVLVIPPGAKVSQM